MERYFNIRYEFDVAAVHRAVRETLAAGQTGYICVADGNILSIVHRDEAYRRTIDGAMFSICDSRWVPVYLKRLYGINRTQYYGAQFFEDIVKAGEYSMAFVGTVEATLADLRAALVKWNPAVAESKMMALPFRRVEDFDYPGIAEELNACGAQIIWVALGAPKQERFMQLIQPYLRCAVMSGVGAVFNFYSGHIKRAPQWVIRMHMEFLYRILAEPGKQLHRCIRILKTMPSVMRAERSQREKL